ncbi:GAP family protein [Microbacterium sp. 179-I 3D3 NHS]|uniref:GAP family protein n=1 Tax=unclassified Microbacterium TaxID=2609290 RepID=UPI0039A3B131
MAPIISLAIAVAFTVLPIVAIIGILVDTGRASRGWMLTAGYAVGLASVFLVATAGLVRLSIPKLAHPAVVEVVAGAALLVVALVLHLLRGREKGTGRSPRAASDHGRIGPVQAALVGLQFAVHPENLILIAAAAAKAAVFDSAGRALAAVAFTVVAVSTVALPSAASAIWGERAGPVLGRVKRWFSHNSGRLTTIALAVIGTVLLVVGVVNMLVPR